MSNINAKVKDVTKSIDEQCINKEIKKKLENFVQTATKLKEDNTKMRAKITEIHDKIPPTYTYKSSKGGKSKKQKRKIIFRKRKTIRRRGKF